MTDRRYDGAWRATLSGILDRRRPGPPAGELGPEDRLDGRACLVTGASSGLGLAAACQLAARGARVLMACRTLDEGRRRQVAAAAPGAQAELLPLDLARLQSVERLCADLARRGERLQLLVINAAVVARRARRTADGFEEMLQVNYLAQAHLVLRLLADGTLPNRALAAPGRGADPGVPRPRVVFVSSEEHRAAAHGPWAELGRFADFGVSGSLRRYAHSKLLLSTFAGELGRRLGPGGAPEVAVHALCPGAVDSNIAREAPRWSQPLLRAVFRRFFSSPEAAAAPVLYLGCARALEGQTGLYLHLMSRKDPSAEAQDPRAGAALWEATARLLRQGPPA